MMQIKLDSSYSSSKNKIVSLFSYGQFSVDSVLFNNCVKSKYYISLTLL